MIRAIAEDVVGVMRFNEDDDEWGDHQNPWEAFVRQLKAPSDLLDREATVAFKDAVRSMVAGDTSDELRSGNFEFYCQDGFELCLPELGPPRARWTRRYANGNLAILSPVDSLTGTVARYVQLIGRDVDVDLAEMAFDSYLWRFVLDATRADVFEHIFVEAFMELDHLRRAEEEWAAYTGRISYMLCGMSTIRQHRYPRLHEDCEDAARKYDELARAMPDLIRAGV